MYKQRHHPLSRLERNNMTLFYYTVAIVLIQTALNTTVSRRKGMFLFQRRLFIFVVQFASLSDRRQGESSVCVLQGTLWFEPHPFCAPWHGRGINRWHGDVPLLRLCVRSVAQV